MIIKNYEDFLLNSPCIMESYITKQNYLKYSTLIYLKKIIFTGLLFFENGFVF